MLESPSGLHEMTPQCRRATSLGQGLEKAVSAAKDKGNREWLSLSLHSFYSCLNENTMSAVDLLCSDPTDEGSLGALEDFRGNAIVF